MGLNAMDLELSELTDSGRGRLRRVVVYSHDTFGLGNMRRMTAIAEHLVASDPEVNVLMISGSNALPAFGLPDRIDYVKLPCLARDVAGHYGAKSLRIDLDRLISLRANIILNTILDFEPELVLVDKKPYGVNGELGPVLSVLSRRVASPRLVLVLRDILDGQEETRSVWTKARYHELIDQHYSSVLVVGDPQVFDLAQEYDFPQSTRDKLTYCGYLMKKDAAPSPVSRNPDDSPLVLVTPGGGQDGECLLSACLNAVMQTPRPRRTAIFCGPEMNAETAAGLRSCAEARGVEWHQFTQNMPEYMRSADVLVTMAGYNTITEGLALGKPMVVVPRTKPTREQELRAERLARLGAIRMIHPDELSAGRMAATIEQALADGPGKAFAGLNFNGLHNVRSALQAVL